MTITSSPPAATTRPAKRVGGHRAGVAAHAARGGLGGDPVLRLGDAGLLVQLFAFTPYVAAWVWLPALIAPAQPALAGRRRGGGRGRAAGGRACCRGRWPTATAVRPPASSCTCSPRTCWPAAPTRPPSCGLVRDHDVAVLAMQEFTPGIQARLTEAGLDALLPYSSLAAGVRHHRLGGLLPLPDHRGRVPAQRRRLHAGVRDDPADRRRAAGDRVGAPGGAVRPAGARRLARRPGRTSPGPIRTARRGSCSATSTRRSTTRRCAS